MFAAYFQNWTPTTRLFAVVAAYVITVNISRGLRVTRRGQKSFRTTTVALAIVLGFSERLFARMVGRSENYITGQLDGTNTKNDTQ
jgi:hypothetical protein